jgi:hypothetical protein
LVTHYIFIFQVYLYEEQQPIDYHLFALLI